MREMDCKRYFDLKIDLTLKKIWVFTIMHIKNSYFWRKILNFRLNNRFYSRNNILLLFSVLKNGKTWCFRLENGMEQALKKFFWNIKQILNMFISEVDFFYIFKLSTRQMTYFDSELNTLSDGIKRMTLNISFNLCP